MSSMIGGHVFRESKARICTCMVLCLRNATDQSGLIKRQEQAKVTPIGSYPAAIARSTGHLWGHDSTNRVLYSYSIQQTGDQSGLIQLQHTADRRPIGSYTATAYGRPSGLGRIHCAVSKPKEGYWLRGYIQLQRFHSRSQQVNSSHSGITA